MAKKEYLSAKGYFTDKIAICLVSVIGAKANLILQFSPHCRVQQNWAI